MPPTVVTWDQAEPMGKNMTASHRVKARKKRDLESVGVFMSFRSWFEAERLGGNPLKSPSAGSLHAQPVAVAIECVKGAVSWSDRTILG